MKPTIVHKVVTAGERLSTYSDIRLHYPIGKRVVAPDKSLIFVYLDRRYAEEMMVELRPHGRLWQVIECKTCSKLHPLLWQDNFHKDLWTNPGHWHRDFVYDRSYQYTCMGVRALTPLT